jgi:hypothetical protein
MTTAMMTARSEAVGKFCLDYLKEVLMPTKDDLLKRIGNDYTYHAPKPGQPQQYERIRHACKEVAQIVVEETPISREQSLALTHLEEAVFWANAAIARNE